MSSFTAPFKQCYSYLLGYIHNSHFTKKNREADSAAAVTYTRCSLRSCGLGDLFIEKKKQNPAVILLLSREVSSNRWMTAVSVDLSLH